MAAAEPSEDRPVLTDENDRTDASQARSVYPSPSLDEDTLTIPVIEEHLEVHKELRKQGVVHVRKEVQNVDFSVVENLASETVQVQRVPIDQLIDILPSVRSEGNVTIVPVVEEVAIVTKRLRLIEEIHITRTRSSRLYEATVPLRSETVTVERTAHSDDSSDRRS